MIGDAIRARRLDLGLRQKDVAKLIGCDKTSITNWEKNHTQPCINHLAGVVKFLGYNPFEKCDTMAQRLASYRKAAGVSQKNFALQLGVDQSTLAKWERMEREPKGKYLLQVQRIIEELRSVGG